MPSLNLLPIASEVYPPMTTDVSWRNPARHTANLDRALAASPSAMTASAGVPA